MSNKRHERWYLERLREGLPDFPSGTVEAGESPDFIVSDGENSVGIEITVFHLEPPRGARPHQEQQSLKDAVVALASRLHQDMGDPGLYVSCTSTNPFLSLSEPSKHWPSPWRELFRKPISPPQLMKAR